jgi:HK97 family phage portal protein
MKWYNPLTWKLNPAQQVISYHSGSSINTDIVITYLQAFDRLETVNRGTNMIVSACSSLDFDLKSKVPGMGVVPGAREKQVLKLLNFQPNPYQSIQDFRNNIFTDFILEGNIFIYYDGAHIYHLPALNMQIVPDPKTFVREYKYNGQTTFKPDEIIHIKELNSSSIYRGTSRLSSANRSIRTLWKMQEFQDQFFQNGAVMGLIFTTENTLSQIAKDKTIAGWTAKYNVTNGAKKPMILDSGMKPVANLAQTFQEMDFDTSIATHDTKILKALGVPPILLDGGNNANISPNLRLFYLETILPIVTRYTSAMERYFGYDLAPVISNVSALQPELKDVAAYHSSLVNGGILSANEARLELRYAPDKDPSSDKLRIPANIAGSAANPSVGGAPPKAPKKQVEEPNENG